MLNFHKNHKSLIITAFGGFLILSVLISIIPAYQMQDVEPLKNESPLGDAEKKGLDIYISEGCVACHTQQVRNIEMDEVWGDRPSLPSDYYYSKQRLDIWRQSPSLLGSERTGPDLTNIGSRQSSLEWHLLHLYNPRSVVKASVMPGYPWLFKEKDTAEITEDDIVVPLSESIYNIPGKQIVAGQDALHLVAYLQSLKQTPLMGNKEPEFIPSSKRQGQSENSNDNSNSPESSLPDGKKLYVQTCSVCHQQDGSGLRGAFPPLAGSDVVNQEDPKLLIRIMLQGYDARSEYGQMPGFAAQLTDKEIAAIANHERSSWGNNAPRVTPEKVKEIRTLIMENL